MTGRLAQHVGTAAYLGVGAAVTLVLGVVSVVSGYLMLTGAMLAGGGFAVLAMMGIATRDVSGDVQSRATESILRTTSKTLMYMREGLSEENCAAVCLLLLPETGAAAIAMTDTEQTLAYVGEEFTVYRPGTSNSAPVREVLGSRRMQTFAGMRRAEWQEVADLRREAADIGSKVARCPVSVILPLIVSGRAVGTMKLYYREGLEVDRRQLAIARGLAEILSTQLTVSELERQTELTAQAEIRALQAQINPHFLFNTLNTMASLTRTDPTRARELLREFSTFYRATLRNGAQERIELATELEQTRRYLRIEKARFGEDRIIDTYDITPGCEGVMVPGFVVQPLVENAVRHAMDPDEPLRIAVRGVADGDDLLLSVTDDGLGMDEETRQRMLRGSAWQVAQSEAQGTGVALHNVVERVQLCYGAGSGVRVESKLGAGTSVELRLAGAVVAPGLAGTGGGAQAVGW